MGLFDWLKKKETKEVQSKAESVAPYTSDMIKKVMDDLRRDTEKSVIRIQVNDNTVGLTSSKFGGLPYIPKNAEVPKDDSGRQLRLLAQIRLEELPKNDIFIPKGIMQFWALDDNSTGLDFDDLTSQKGSRVTFYEEIDPSVTEQEVLEKYQPYCEGESYFPVQNTFSLSFSLEKEGMSTNDYRFNKMFAKRWNEAYPQSKIESYFDLPQELTEDMYNEVSGFGHKLGGYPAFTQEDPRDEANRYCDHQMLLLQMDSIGTKAHEIMWGDSGICNYFISEKAFKERDFSKVIYNWDCY